MKKFLCASAFLALLTSLPAHAATVVDATGDFLPGFTGPASPDLDVTSFSVVYRPGSKKFTVGADLAGVIDPAVPGFYVIGVNTGTGVIDPFDAIGQGNVVFNQAIVVQKNATGSVGATPLTNVSASGNQFSATLPLSLLPSTGFAPLQYGFNLWPRTGLGNELISDFAPENALLNASVVPEPASWIMMLMGFGALGAAMRTVRSQRKPSASSA